MNNVTRHKINLEKSIILLFISSEDWKLKVLSFTWVSLQKKSFKSNKICGKYVHWNLQITVIIPNQRGKNIRTYHVNELERLIIVKMSNIPNRSIDDVILIKITVWFFVEIHANPKMYMGKQI